MRNLLYFLFFIFSVITGCGNSPKVFPSEFTGSWNTVIPIEGTEGQLEMNVLISGDTIIVRQTYPRMSGIDKTKSTYIADKMNRESDSLIYFYSTSNSGSSRISIELRPTDKLKISFCQLNSADNKDAEFTSCNEWGEFEKDKE